MEIYRLITSTEVETVIKNLSKKQKPRTIQLHSWILSNIKRFNTYPSQTLPHKNKKKKLQKGIQSNSCYQMILIWDT